MIKAGFDVLPKKKANDVIGSIEFGQFLDKISHNDPSKKEFLEAFKILKEDCLRGNKISHDRWPAIYVRKYRIKNLGDIHYSQAGGLYIQYWVRKTDLSFVFLKLFHIMDMKKDLVTSLQKRL